MSGFVSSQTGKAFFKGGGSPGESVVHLQDRKPGLNPPLEDWICPSRLYTLSIKGMWGFGVSPFPQTKEPFSLWWVEGTSTERPSRCAGMLKQMSNISSGGERGTVPALKSALAFSSAAPFSSDPPPPRASRRRRHFWVKLLRFAVLPPSEESPQVQLRRLHLHRYSGYITKG